MWIAFFSQTGSEIYNIASRLDRAPGLIFTNNEDHSTWHPGLRELNSIFVVGKHKQLMSTLMELNEKHLVTLHGYLRILPAEVVSQFEVINGHPAPIHLYPELKGKDRQEDLYKYKERYDRIGCVIHRAAAEVDTGEILVAIDEPNTLNSIDESYLKIKGLSLKSWEIFFNDYLPNTLLNKQ
jgi:folate-dependent phosphoribosylglycinamide formyltransferase PurN